MPLTIFKDRGRDARTFAFVAGVVVGGAATAVLLTLFT